jgi:cellulose 1,4-beta-cellobiosidase
MGNWGSCCNEVDIWEANLLSTAYVTHPCTRDGLYRCTAGTDCSSICDSAGCDFNPFRLGNPSYYGPANTINTNGKFTVITRFLTVDGTSTGVLKEIRRLYIQNGKVIQNSKVNIPDMAPYDSISEAFCADKNGAFNETGAFTERGGYKAIDTALERGMVLVLSLTKDYAGSLWLDSVYPPNADPSTLGAKRGNCPTTPPVTLPVESPPPKITISNIRFGDIGSTH